MPNELELGACPLLKDQGLVDAFNSCIALKQQIEDSFGTEFLQDPVLLKWLQQLDRLHGKLIKTHYSIGFIGVTQNGKSAAVNHVLNAIDNQDKPGREGAGGNTTATVTRMHRGPRSLQLVYMTRHQVMEKMTFLRDASGFDPELPDIQVQQQIPQRKRDFDKGTGTRTREDREILPRDLELLDELITASSVHRALIDRAPTPQMSLDGRPIVFEDRGKFLNYGPGAHPANALLREAIIGYESEFLPPDLEMFDLPGPGAKSSIDGWTTRNFLEYMDGAMLFISAAKIEEGPTEDLITWLKEVFRERMPHRVWLVFTRWDSPTRSALVGDEERSVFSIIHEFLKSKKIDPKQIRFVVSPWYLVPRDFVETHFRSRLGSSTDSIPPALQDYPQFNSPFQELFNQGGIPALRKLILEDLPREVRKELRAECETGLAAIQEGLTHRYDNEFRRRNSSHQERLVASSNSVRTAEILMELDRCREPFGQAALDLAKELGEVFKAHCPSAEVLDFRDRTAALFPSHTELLEQTMYLFVDTTLIPRLYDYWQPRFDSLGKIRVLGNEGGPTAVWQQFGTEDERSGKWRGPQFPTFIDPRLFEGLDASYEADLQLGTAYWKMMTEKIHLVAQQAAHAIRVRLTYRVLQIQIDLEQLVDSSNRAAASPARTNSHLNGEKS